MITLPPGFDVGLLMGDFFMACLAFTIPAALFLGYRMLSKCLGGVH